MWLLYIIAGIVIIYGFLVLRRQFGDFMNGGKNYRR